MLNIFREHSLQLPKKALHVCNVTLAMERFLGDIHPRAGLVIYSAQVDSVLIHGSQIVGVTVNRTVKYLGKVQVIFPAPDACP